MSWNALSGTFHYHTDSPSSLQLASADSTIDLTLHTDADQLLVDIEQLQLLGTGISASGSLQIDTHERTLQADLDGVVAELLPVQLELSADRDALTFSGRGLDGVTTIRPIVELLRLSPAIEVWIAQYLHGHEFDLETVSGSIPYDDPAALLQNLHAVVQVRQVAYRFAQGLAPILAERASVEFSAGVLHRARRMALGFV